MSEETPVWFITGCTSGFGREIALAALHDGARVVITARSPEKLEALATVAPERSLVLPLDVTDAAMIDQAVARAEEHFGRIDALVNNAGYGYFSAIEEGEDAEYRRLFETNVFGLVRLTQRVLPGMRKQRSGHIFNISSIGGLMSFPGVGFYCATKFAVEALTEALAQEVAPLGIKATCVEPGAFRTDFAGRSASEPETRIADYDATAHAVTTGLQVDSGHQPGDPARLAQALLSVYKEENPPRQLLMGPDAYQNATQTLEQRLKNFQQWRALTESTDFR